MERSDHEYVAFDVETTGLSPWQGARIIELGAVAINDGKISDEFQSLINPKVRVPQSAQFIHGISDEMLIGQPGPSEVLPGFVRFIGNSVLVAHNAKFDLSFLRAELVKLGIGLINRSKCTLQMSRRRLPGLINYRLDTVARHVLGGLPKNRNRHRALDDARLVAMMWLEMMK